jgi:hypothetical protein
MGQPGNMNSSKIRQGSHLVLVFGRLGCGIHSQNLPLVKTSVENVVKSVHYGNFFVVLTGNGGFDGI